MENIKSLTPDEVAAILNITKQTVYEIIKRGQLPAYRIGRKLRIDPKDVDLYRQQGKNFAFQPPETRTPDAERNNFINVNRGSTGHALDKLVLCGQDIILDILARYMEQSLRSLHVLRYQVGSFDGLSALYHGQADMAAIHLWDGERDQYNVPYVRHLLPGVPVLIVHLAQRMQGFYVGQGNPKRIAVWQDLQRPDITIVNREKGSGTRILLDEQLRCLGIDNRMIKGYEREEYSHLAVASTVARGEADLAIGSEKASLQVRGIEFVPLQKERYELVVKKTNIEVSQIKAILDILRSRAFQAEVQGLGDYDLTETGKIIAEF